MTKTTSKVVARRRSNIRRVLICLTSSRHGGTGRDWLRTCHRPAPELQTLLFQNQIRQVRAQIRSSSKWKKLKVRQEEVDLKHWKDQKKTVMVVHPRLLALEIVEEVLWLLWLVNLSVNVYLFYNNPLSLWAKCSTNLTNWANEMMDILGFCNS